MPIYEYECVKCGSQIEAWQRFSDQPLTACESCGGKLKKLISQSTFHLKGTGWYVTDYASKSASHSGGSVDKAAGSSTSDTGSSSKDTTPKATKETSGKKDSKGTSSKKDTSGK